MSELKDQAYPVGRVPAIEVRHAEEADMEAVQSIYAHHVLKGFATFEEVPPSVHEMAQRRLAVMAAGIPYLVVVRGDEVVGYAYATAYRARPAYRYTIEDSVYVREGLGGQGIGSALLGEMIKLCEQGPWRQMLAIIGDSGNNGSIALHARMRFEHVGVLRAVGYKHGRWVDTVLMQRSLGDGDGSHPPGSRA